MSASDTEIEKQAVNHRPSLLGIGVAVVAVAFVLIGISTFGNWGGQDEATSSEGVTAPTIID